MSTKKYRITCLGGGAGGKTAIIVRFVTNHFVMEYDPTIEDVYDKKFEVDGQECLLHIIDTAGQEEYSSSREAYIPGSQGFVVIYSVTSRSEFEDAFNFIETILRVKGTRDVPVVIVGNKCDLAGERQVSTREGEDLARQFDCSFFETSAKENICIDEAFTEIVKLIDEHENAHQELKGEGGKEEEERKDVPKEKKGKKKFLDLFKRKK